MIAERRFNAPSPAPLAVPASLAAALALAALGCGGIDLGGVNVFSVEDEWKLGQELRPEVEKDLELVHDAEALRLLDAMGQDLARHTRLAGKPWTFHLVRDDAINAFNIPGGHVYVNDGLIAAAADASEFASVLAHEVAHGAERHATQQMTRAYGLQVVLAMAVGRNPGALAGIAGQLVAGGTLSHHGREAEREADSVGLKILTAAGYDPNGMVAMFERLLAVRQGKPGRVAQNFASHPLTEARIADARRAIAAQPVQGGLRADTEAFRQLKSRLAR